MAKTLKALLDTVNDETGFDRASNYVSSTDPNIRTLVAVANRAARYLRELSLQQLVRQCQISLADGTVDPSEDPQGRISYFALPQDFFAYTPDTSYQDGRIDPAQLPTPAPTWAYLISRSGPQSLRVRCRILRDRLYVFSPDATQFINFEYISSKPITVHASGIQPSSSVFSDVFTTDADTWDLDDSLIELEIKWRYKQVKALDWQTDKQDSDLYQNALRGRESGATTLYPPNAWPYPAEPYTNLWVDN